MKRLEAEYNMFFAGRLPRPPWETRTRVNALIKQLDRQHLTNYARAVSIQHAADTLREFIDLWDRGLRAREEGRRGPFAQPKARRTPQRVNDRVVFVTTFDDPLQDMEKVQELYDRLTQARRESGRNRDPVPQVCRHGQDAGHTLKEKGGEEVAFRVALKDGKVAFTARAMRGK